MPAHRRVTLPARNVWSVWMIRILLATALATLAAPWGSWADTRPTCDSLRASLKSPNAKTREESATALAKARCRDIVTPLSALVRDPELRVRRAVVSAL